MPRRQTQTKEGTHKVLKSMSYESTVISWLLQDGWQVFTPVVDNSHKTDILISDGPNYYRIQVKTGETSAEDYRLKNLWKDSHLNIVIFFAKTSNWGYVMPAFSQCEKKLNSEGHEKFDKDNKNSFVKAFHKVDVENYKYAKL